MIRFGGILCFASLICAACQVGFSVAEDYSKALRINPDEDSRQELSQVISHTLNGRDVILSQDAFTHSSVEIIERIQIMGPDGNPIMGRDFSRPDYFTLYTVSSGKCYLHYRREDKRIPLQITRCAIAPDMAEPVP